MELFFGKSHFLLDRQMGFPLYVSVKKAMFAERLIQKMTPLIDEDSVFPRFVWLNEKKESYAPRLGRGLPGVKILAEAMGGEIRLESRVGFGTQLMVHIPPLDNERGQHS